MLVKIDGLLFLDHSGVTAQSKYRIVEYYYPLIIFGL